jgi:drug/metabolite transporter (DMT)-like permease
LPRAFLLPSPTRRIDALLLLMTLIWGSNYAIVKHAFAEIDPQAFNAGRLIVASAVFLAVMGAIRSRPPQRRADGTLASVVYTPSPMKGRDLVVLIGLGIVGRACISTGSWAAWRAPAWRTRR